MRRYEGLVYLKKQPFFRPVVRNTHGWQLDKLGQVENENMRVQGFKSCSSLLRLIQKAIDQVLGIRKTKIIKNLARVNIQLSAFMKIKMNS